MILAALGGVAPDDRLRPTRYQLAVLITQPLLAFLDELALIIAPRGNGEFSIARDKLPADAVEVDRECTVVAERQRDDGRIDEVAETHAWSTEKRSRLGVAQST